MKRLAAIAAALFAFAAFAIEPPKQGPAPAPPQSVPADTQPADDAAKPAGTAPEPAEEELPPLPPDAAPAGPPPQRFNPTEKVRADFPVSFPIDI